jgi:hypothetical protein
MRHVPATHAPAVFALAHGAAHAPQLFASLRVSTSQPSPASELQSANPALHAINKHRPALHVALPLGTLHVRPQAPQCIGLVVRSCSQPLPALPSQSPRFAMHVLSQRPLTHVPIAPPRPTQGRLQSPQFIGSVRVSTQRPPQRACPAGHVPALVSGCDALLSPPSAPASGSVVPESIAMVLASWLLSERVAASRRTDSAPTAQAACVEAAHTIKSAERTKSKRASEGIEGIVSQ